MNKLLARKLLRMFLEYSIGHKSEVRWYANIRIPKVNIVGPHIIHMPTHITIDQNPHWL